MRLKSTFFFRIGVNKTILSIGIAYFDELFSGRSSDQEIKLPWIEADVLQMILEWTYNGEIEIGQDLKTLFRLAEAANRMRISEIVENCLDLFAKYQNMENSVSIWNKSRKFISIKQRSIFAFVGNNFSEIKQSEEFLQLDQEAVIDLLSKLATEKIEKEQIENALFKWINYDPCCRSSAFKTLTESIFECGRERADVLIQKVET